MESQASATSNHRTRVRVWDIPVRLFHWSQLALFVSLFVTAEVLDDKIELHATLGLALLALVLFRLLWGFTGSSYARFSQFLTGPRTVISYLKQKPFIAGHNPLGGWMVVTLLVLVLIQAILGLFANDDIMFDGPLAYLVSKDTSDLMTELHEFVFHLILPLVGLHVAAMIWHKLRHGENLLPAMFTGHKDVPPGTQAQDAHGGGLLLAAALLAISAGIVYALVA